MKRNKTYKRWVRRNKQITKQNQNNGVTVTTYGGKYRKVANKVKAVVFPKAPPINYDTASLTLAQLRKDEKTVENVITQIAKELDDGKKGLVKDVIDRQFEFLKCIIKENYKRGETG